MRNEKLTGWVMWKKNDEGDRVFWSPADRLVSDIRSAFIFKNKNYARRVLSSNYEIARVEKGVIVQESVGLDFSENEDFGKEG